MATIRLCFIILGLFYLNTGFTVPANAHFCQDKKSDPSEISVSDSEFKAGDIELSDTNLTESVVVKTNVVFEKNLESGRYKYLSLHDLEVIRNYLKASTLIYPGLDQFRIIYPFHDFI